jgi:hypothetical protein
MPRMVLAQAAAEYVGVSTVMQGLSGLWSTLEYQFSQLGNSGYTFIAVALIGLLVLCRSRR